MASGLGGSSGTDLGGNAVSKQSSPSIFGKALHIANKVFVQPNANLLHDVTSTVEGLPMGLIGSVEHPIRAGEAMVSTTWHTWSPLFHGDFMKFGKQVYDHPLAPLLDVASVFSVGLGTAAKAGELAIGTEGVARVGAKLSAAGPKTFEATQPLTKTEKLASLRMGGKIELNPLAGQKDLGTQVKMLSRRPGRRVLQEAVLKLDKAGHLPDWYVKARYDRYALVEMAHRVAAKNEVISAALKSEAKIPEGIHPVQKGADPGFEELASHSLQYRTIFRAAQTLGDITDLGKKARTSVYIGMFSGLVRHNTAYDEARAISLVKGGHHVYAIDPVFHDRKYWTQLKWAKRQHANATQALSTHLNGFAGRKLARDEANLAHHEAQAQGLARTEADLQKANDTLAEYHAQGRTIQGGARDASNRLISQPNKKQLMNYTANDVHVLQERIKTLEAQRERALNSQKATVGLKTKIEGFHQKRQALENKIADAENTRAALENRSVADLFAHVGESHDSFLQAVTQFGSPRNGATTTNLAHALRDTNGKVYVVPAHDAYNLSIEAGNSVKLLRYIVHKPTQFWKNMTIKYTPRTITNNGIGNWMMYSMTHMGPSGVHAMHMALSHEFGSDVVGHNLYKRNHFMDINHLSDLADNYGVGQGVIKSATYDEAGNMLTKPAVHMEDLSLAGKARQQGVYGIVNATSERPVRVAAIYHTYLSMPEVKAEVALARKGGLKGQDAVDAGISRATKANPDLIKEASLAQRRVAGDYLTMNATEKWLKDIIPFYLWNRHILKNTTNILLDNPVKGSVAARLSAYGIQQTEAYGGNMPDFMKGAIPLAALGFGDRPGRMNFLATSSLNPYQTVGDMADSLDAMAVSGGKRRGAAVSQANPLLVGAFESVFQTNALTGVPSPRTGSVLGDTLARSFEQFPYVKAAGVFASGDQFKTPKGNDLMFGRTKLSTITSLAGTPIKDTSLQRMHDLFDQLAKTHKKKGGLGASSLG